MRWLMGKTFAEKFEEALEEIRDNDPSFGIRTIARRMSNGDRERIETIRRRLNKYRPKNGGSAGEVAPSPPTRREIEDAMGLPPDSLRPDPLEEADALVAVLMPSEALRRIVREEMAAGLL